MRRQGKLFPQTGMFLFVMRPFGVRCHLDGQLFIRDGFEQGLELCGGGLASTWWTRSESLKPGWMAFTAASVL